MNEAIEILGIACAVSILFTLPIYAKFIGLIKIKPFTCEMCMGFWACLGYSIAIYGADQKVLFMSFICALSTNLIYKQITKWS